MANATSPRLFWFIRNRFVGSYCRLQLRQPRVVRAVGAACTRSASSSVMKFT